MGVSISYATATPVSTPVRDAVIADSARLNTEHVWWCENLVFFEDPDRPTHLVGDTKLYLPGYSLPAGGFVEVDPDDDSFMAYRDARFILATLSEWARVHHITWELSVLEPIGTVTPRGPDDEVREYFALMATEAGLDDPEVPPSEGRASELDRRYASRDDPAV